MTQVKICGVKTENALKATIEAGADYVGFVFYPPSPRYIDLETAKTLAKLAKGKIKIVGLFVDPEDNLLDEVRSALDLDMVQLHGGETPARIRAIKERFNCPIMKAVRVGNPEDLQDIATIETAADWLLFDAKPKDATLPGGTGHQFDWSLLEGRTFTKPWMLSGGLDADNVKQALSLLNPTAIDISSGVESKRGVKAPEKIKSFIKAVKG